jgi:glutamate racemase
LATESTVQGGAYERAIYLRRPDAHVYSQACSLFVALAEEGWIQGSLVKSVVKEYLYPLLREKKRDGLDCLVLGCTHFPLLKDTIAEVAGPDMKLVDSGETVAVAVEKLLAGKTRNGGKGSARYLATDGPERFARVGSLFLGETIDPSDVEMVDL